MAYDENKYIEHKFPHPNYINWLWNPIFSLFEIFLGMRMPKRYLILKNTDKPFTQRQCVQCDSCNTIYHQNDIDWLATLGNWFGVYCPKCNDEIPCHWNIFSYVFIVLLSPIWIPIKLVFGKRLKERTMNSFSADMETDATLNKWVGYSVSYIIGVVTFFCSVMLSIWVLNKALGIFQIDWKHIKFILLGSIVSAIPFTWFMMNSLQKKDSAVFNHANLSEANPKKSLLFSVLRNACFLIFLAGLFFFAKSLESASNTGINYMESPFLASVMLWLEALLSEVGVYTKSISTSIALSYLVIFSLLLRNSERLINDFEKKQGFTEKSVKNCSYIAWSFLIIFILDAVNSGFLIENLLMNLNENKFDIHKGRSSSLFKMNLGYLLVSILFFAISNVLQQGSKLEEELEGTI